MSSWKRRSLLRPDSHTPWDTGGLKDSDSEENSDRRKKLIKIYVPLSLYALIATASCVKMEEEERHEPKQELSRTELDSHAN
jgi:hypothetical protein